MSMLSPQAGLLMLCISRLPEQALPRHSWAAEVLVEQLWVCANGVQSGSWGCVLSSLIGKQGVESQRVRAAVWELAQAGALVPTGVGTAARFEASERFCSAAAFDSLSVEQESAVDYAVDQLTARLLAFSKTASVC
ncbi:hypothetical protein [Nocardia sp. SC052]|uniref:hypothetical protein n=1 Tax=Nocardia sichangensis TaxID=3385975 RepID=UPI0039A1F47E